MRSIKYICALICLGIYGGYDVKAAGPKVYSPVAICDCGSGGPCVCEDCKCGTALAMADVKEKAPKTENGRVKKTKYLSYYEAVKAAEVDGKEIHTYIGEYPPSFLGNVGHIVFEENLAGYKYGDVIVSKFFAGKHERISLNGVTDNVVHTSVAAPATTVTWVKQCVNGVCTMVPQYSTTPSAPVQYSAPQYYYQSGCPNGQCGK